MGWSSTLLPPANFTSAPNSKIMSGKGSGRRPQEITDSEMIDNWSSIFGPSLLERRRREQALDEMVRINEELGLYDEPELQEPEKSST